MANREATFKTAVLILLESKPVLGVTELLSSVVVGSFQFISDFIQQVLSWSFHLLHFCLEFFMFKIVPGIGQVASSIVEIILNMITLGLKSISNVTVYSYETLVQLNWQLYFLTFVGFIVKLIEVIVNCTAIAVGIVLYALLQSAIFIVTTVKFIAIHSWHITVKVVEVIAGGIVGTAELISSGTNLMIASETLKLVVTVVFYLVGMLILILVLIKFKPHRKVSRWLKLKVRPVPQQRAIRENLDHHEVFTPHRAQWSPDTRVNRKRSHRRSSSGGLRQRRYPSMTDDQSVEHDYIDIAMREEEQDVDKYCAVCFVNPPKLVIKPCGHYCLCLQCQNKVRICPVCDIRIWKVQRRDRSLVRSRSRRSPSPYSTDEGVRQSHSNSPDQNKKEKERLEEELTVVKKQLEKEEEAKLCAVCLDKPRTLIVQPCKHYCLCEDCRSKLRRCPICNCYISSAEKIYNV